MYYTVNSFGAYLTYVRKKKRKTLKDLGKCLNISSMYLAGIEHGKQIPSDELVSQLATILDVDPFEFIKRLINDANKVTLVFKGDTAKAKLAGLLAKHWDSLSEEKIEHLCNVLDIIPYYPVNRFTLEGRYLKIISNRLHEQIKNCESLSQKAIRDECLERYKKDTDYYFSPFSEGQTFSTFMFLNTDMHFPNQEMLQGYLRSNATEEVFTIQIKKREYEYIDINMYKECIQSNKEIVPTDKEAEGVIPVITYTVSSLNMRMNGTKLLYEQIKEYCIPVEKGMPNEIQWNGAK